MSKLKFFKLYHRDKNVKTIKQFLERESIYGITPEEFFKLNKEVIFSQMTESDKILNKNKWGIWPTSSDILTVNVILPCPCYLIINLDKVSEEMAISQTNFQLNNSDYYAFANEKIQEILKDPGYKIPEYNKLNPTCQVFGWFKSLYFLNETGVSSKDITAFSDLSDHIISLSTSVTSNGGSFTMKLPIIKSNDEGFISLGRIKDKKHIGDFGRSSKNKSIYENNYGKGFGYYSKMGFEESNSSYYNWLITSNDLIFITFEPLQMQLSGKIEAQVSKDFDIFNIHTNISEGIYDMIGLIDEIRVVTNSSDSSAYIEVSGRDLMKLLIDDGSFFFDNSSSKGGSVFLNESDAFGKNKRGDELAVIDINNPSKRLRNVDDTIFMFLENQNKDLDFILKGVISKLANIEIVPNYVFDSWGDERTKFNDLIPKK